MKKIHHSFRSSILQVIDWFYPFFKRLMPIQTFRYAACGGVNTSLDIFIFWFGYNFVFKKQLFDAGIITLQPHIAAFFLSFIFTFPIGFYLSRYVVFQETSVGKREQLIKYFVVVLGCFFLNYIFLKIFVEWMGWFPTPSKIFTTFFVIIFSYITQKNFTFKAKN